jgi:hypothetical protein
MRRSTLAWLPLFSLLLVPLTIAQNNSSADTEKRAKNGC